MQRLVFILTALLGSVYLQAQDLIIEYDYLSKTSAYYKINKKGDTVQVRSPLVKQNQDVVVRVVNFNELALAAETEVSAETLVESSNPFGMFSMLSPIFNVASTDVLTNLFGESGVDISDVEYQLGFSAEDAESDEQLSDARDEFVDLSNTIYDLSQLEASIENLEYGLNQLYILSRNTTLRPQEIKEQARTIVSTSLNNSDNPQLTHFYRKRESILQETAQYIRLANRSGKDILKYKKLENEPNFGFASEENAVMYEQLAEETEVLLKAVDKFQSSYSKEEIEQMLQLMQELYFTIQNSSFTYNTTALAEGDRTNINLSFYEIPEIPTIEHEPKDTSTSGDSYDWEEYDEFDQAERQFRSNARLIRTKSFKVKVSGGLKISPSVGITFPSYFNESKDYFAQGDTLIVETKGDNYTPNITAFVNFYPYTGRAVNFGGTFGVGIPVKGKIAPSFMIGGALVLGNEYRITVTAGMATGPVTRLEKGLEPGYDISPFDDIETRTKYAVGFYSGISFTLGK